MPLRSHGRRRRRDDVRPLSHAAALAALRAREENTARLNARPHGGVDLVDKGRTDAR